MAMLKLFIELVRHDYLYGILDILKSIVAILFKSLAEDGRLCGL